ncbi:hypothetical protein [Streptomyces sp. KMM 9044]|uniref:hypothetical protein n=1 Tax=Streptomyces sp. KMM 9044 TaxID=2744474 RepID=UPI0021510855|nr:hypothetical protein [Streptomyces sp. KMM 9044]WAX82163.1 hypothetical protein HUV60_009900 [Streptomyces sp. KMM 9044]
MRAHTARVRRRHRPVDEAHGRGVVRSGVAPAFAQTGSAVLPRFPGHGVSAVCAEPYPFFWLDGGPGTVHRYRADTPGGAR